MGKAVRGARLRGEEPELENGTPPALMGKGTGECKVGSAGAMPQTVLCTCDSLASDLFAGCSESSLLEWGGDGRWPVRCLGWIYKAFLKAGSFVVPGKARALPSGLLPAPLSLPLQVTLGTG